MEFVSMDVETANADLASICQIGIATFRNGAIADEWETYVDPEDFFDLINVSIHGIRETTVKGQPNLPKVADKIRSLLGQQIVVSHTHFDRVSIHQAFSRHAVAPPECAWLDSARVARRAWSRFSTKGYGLEKVSKFIKYKFKHHDALEDAKAAGHIVLAAVEETGLSVDDWVKRVRQPILLNLEGGGSPAQEGNPEGPLHGEVIVFTGALSISRQEAANLAASKGCRVTLGVSPKTTLLVVGDQDVRKFKKGQKKSSKHRRAEALISSGHPLRILRETDFCELLDL